MRVLLVAKELFADCNANEISYCHWKSNEHLLEGLAGDTDLDVLVDKKYSDKATAILKKHNYIFVNSQFGSRYQNVEDWIACDDETKKLIHIHLHYAIITGHAGLKEYNLPWTELALATRVLNEEYQIYVTEPNLEAVLLLSRIGLKATMKTKFMALTNKYSLSDDDIREIKYLIELINKSNVFSIAEPYFKKSTEDLINLLYAEQYHSRWIKKLISITNHELKGYSRFSALSLFYLRPFYSIVLFSRRVLKKCFKIRLISKKSLPNGSNVSIAIIGQDGAGKSTIIQDLSIWLSWKLDVQKYYMGCGDGYHSLVKWLIGICTKNKIGRLVVPFLSVLNYLNVAKQVKRNIRSSKKLAEKGSVILYDRFPQNQFYGINDGPKIREIVSAHKVPGLIRIALLKAAKYEEICYQYAIENSPSTVIKLMVPPEVSIRRKPNERIEDVEQKHHIISSLLFPESEVFSVDATMNFEEEIKFIRGIVWESINKGIKHK